MYSQKPMMMFKKCFMFSNPAKIPTVPKWSNLSTFFMLIIHMQMEMRGPIMCVSDSTQNIQNIKDTMNQSITILKSNQAVGILVRKEPYNKLK